MSTFDDQVFVTPKRQPPAREAQTRDGGNDRVDARAPGPAALLRLQRLAGNAAVVQSMEAADDAEGVGRARSGGGAPLDTDTRAHMEGALGADFSDVRVHTGGEADASARSLGAHAYTVGSDIVFSQGRYDPGSDVGQRTLAHELTHVVQQRSGPVDGTDSGTGVKVSDPSDRYERAAEATADLVMAGHRTEVGAGSASEGRSVQRQGEEEEVQELAVQRQGEEEEVQELAVQRQGEEEEVQELAVQRQGDEEEPAEES